MSGFTVELENGKVVTLREMSAGDVMDCVDQSRNLEVVGGQAVYVVDPVMIERLIMLKSIASVDGEDSVTLNWLRAISSAEYDLIQHKLKEIETATAAAARSKTAGEEGRDSAAS